MADRSWFEISDAGWRRVTSARPLGRLILEAVQNAFDAGAANVDVTLSNDQILVEDDALAGVVDERMVYTIFMSGKEDRPDHRGRFGRGLKELIASMRSAEVNTVGTRVVFDSSGRRSEVGERRRGTLLTLRREFADSELVHARTMLGLCIPPRGTQLTLDEQPIPAPDLMLTLPSCELETVIVEDGVERACWRSTTVSLYLPPEGQQPYLFEMGLPIMAWDVPWHVNVDQRVPMVGTRDAVPERVHLEIKSTLLELMIHTYLDRRDLKHQWVHEVIARWPIKTTVLDAYVSKAFPRGAVLGGTTRANDRARQLGAHVVDTTSITHSAYVALSRVLETADDYVRRRSHEFGGEDVEPDESQLRFAAAMRWLARRIAGRVIRVRFFSRDPGDAGLLEDAVTEPRTQTISFNVRGPVNFDNILEPHTFGVVIHELAHLDSLEHDMRFIDRLQLIAGQAARTLAEGGPTLADALRLGDPDEKLSV